MDMCVVGWEDWNLWGKKSFCSRSFPLVIKMGKPYKILVDSVINWRQGSRMELIVIRCCFCAQLVINQIYWVVRNGLKEKQKKWFFCDYHLEDLKRTTSAKNCLCQATFFRIVININACIKTNLVNRVDRSKCQPLRGKIRNKMKFQHILWKRHGSYMG